MTQEKTPTALQQAGITTTRYESDALTLFEVSHAAILRVRSLAPAPAVIEAFKPCGVELPSEPNQSLGLDPVALCLRARDWLVFSEYLDNAQLQEQVSPAVNSSEAAVYNLSDGMATFRLSGPAAPWLLSKLSGLDFHAAGAAGQHCGRTRMGQVAVLVNYHQPRNGTSPFVFDLIFDRSIARYLWQLLAQCTPHAEEMSKSYGHAA